MSWIQVIQKPWFRLLNPGVDTKLTSPGDSKTVRLVNNLLIVCIILNTLLLGTTLSILNWWNIGMIFFANVLYLSLLFLNYSKHYTLRYHLFEVYLILHLCLLETIFGRETGLLYAFIPLTILPVILFDDWKVTGSYFVVIFMVYLGINIYEANYEPLVQQNIENSKIQYYFNSSMVIVLNFLVFFFMKNTNRTYKEALQVKTDEVREKNNLLKKRTRQVAMHTRELDEANEALQAMHQHIDRLVDEKTRELNLSYRELDSFFFRSSHDFRRPLTTFMGIAQLAKYTIEDTKAVELFEQVSRTAMYMDKMLNKLLMFSEINSEEQEVARTDLQEILEDVRRDYKEIIENKEIDYQYDIQGVDLFIANTRILRIVLRNIIENSFGFAAENNPYVYVRAFAENDCLMVYVKDNGVGIPTEYHHSVFDMYVRANKESQGNGLGLYVVRKGVEKMGGRIDLASEYREGTCIEISIPVKVLSEKESSEAHFYKDN